MARFCETCGGRIRLRGTRRRYCSRVCYQKGRVGERRGKYEVGPRRVLERACDECGKPVSSYPSQARRFCSRGCYSAWRSRPHPGWKVPGNLKTGKTIYELVCEQCQQGFKSTRKKARFCSRACFNVSARHGKRKGDLWSLKYERCVRCGRTDSKHHWNGVCRRCTAVLERRKSRGAVGKVCLICEWDRNIEMAHLVPKKLRRSDEGWNLAPLCPSHHRAFDVSELYRSEFEKLRPLMEVAFDRLGFPLSDTRWVLPEYENK